MSMRIKQAVQHNRYNKKPIWVAFPVDKWDCTPASAGLDKTQPPSRVTILGQLTHTRGQEGQEVACSRNYNRRGRRVGSKWIYDNHWTVNRGTATGSFRWPWWLVLRNRKCGWRVWKAERNEWISCGTHGQRIAALRKWFTGPGFCWGSPATAIHCYLWQCLQILVWSGWHMLLLICLPRLINLLQSCRLELNGTITVWIILSSRLF